MATPRPLEPSDRIRLVPAATRVLGRDLLVNAGGATSPVERLAGTGPELWWSLARGLTIAEAATTLADRIGAPLVEVEAQVLQFATALVEARLAEPAS